jgi:hypothetical protein
MAVQTSSAPHAKIACGEPEGVRRRSVTIKVQASKPLSRQAAKPAFPARDSCAKVALAECLKLGSGERESRRRRTGCHHHSRHGSALAPAGIRQGLAESCPDTATGLGENEPGISCQADGAGLTGRKRTVNSLRRMATPVAPIRLLPMSSARSASTYRSCRQLLH